jgi:hypothetical protein
VNLRETRESQQVVHRVAEHRLNLGQLPAEHPGDDVKLLLDVLGVGLREDGSDGGGDHLGVALRHDRENVAHEMHAATLPCGADQDRCASLHDQPVGPQVAQEAVFDWLDDQLR